MQIKATDDLKNQILLEDISKHNITNPANIFLAQSYVNKISNYKNQGNLEESVLIESYLVPVKQKEYVSSFHFGDLGFASETYFEDDGSYNTGEFFEKSDVDFEIIINERVFPGLSLSYFEPTDRLIKYLNLHRVDDDWLNPYANDKIIVKQGESRDYEPHDTYY